MNSALSRRKTTHLHIGRVSQPGRTYFVTCCTKDRRPVFSSHAEALRAVVVLRGLHASRDVELLAAAVMPDHVHLLFTLGERLRLGQVIAKFKSLTRDLGQADWAWQKDGFEHQLRPGESMEDYGFYIFMNPYRAKLLSMSERWPTWLCPDMAKFSFSAHLQDGTPLPTEWLEKSVQLRARLIVR